MLSGKLGNAVAFTRKIAALDDTINETMAEIMRIRIAVAEGKIDAATVQNRLDELVSRLQRSKADKLSLAIRRRTIQD
jgi:uncharacterized membrane protein YjjP (DUF1212 family)